MCELPLSNSMPHSCEDAVMGNLEKIAAKVKKLLSLSTSNNPNEAANAAAQAAKLIQEYQLDEAILESAGEIPAEEVESGNVMFEGKNKIGWRGNIASGCARLCGCLPYWSGGNYKCVGRKSDVDTAKYLMGFIFRQVDEMADRAYNAIPVWENPNLEPGKTWKGAFRYGASLTIKERLLLEKQKRADELKVKAMENNQISSALAIIDKTAIAVKNEAAKLGLGSVRVGTGGNSYDGYNAGKQAGHNVRIHSSGSGALTAGKKALR
jgi:hypothetical protein